MIFFHTDSISKKKAALIVEKAGINDYFHGFIRNKSKVFISGKTRIKGTKPSEASKTIVIDVILSSPIYSNRKQSCRDQIAKNHANGILISSFANGEDDEALLKLIPFLIYVSKVVSFFFLFSLSEK